MYNTRRFCVEVVFPCSPEKIKLELYETYVSYMAKEKYNIHNICSRLETKYEYKNWFDLVRIGAFVYSVEFNLSIPNQPGDPTISKDKFQWVLVGAYNLYQYGIKNRSGKFYDVQEMVKTADKVFYIYWKLGKNYSIYKQCITKILRQVLAFTYIYMYQYCEAIVKFNSSIDYKYNKLISVHFLSIYHKMSNIID